MAGLEDLRPFIWLCQICGFFPYRMEVDAVTKRFKRFTFSYFHPVTFWYLFVQFCSFASYYVLGLYKTQKMEQDPIKGFSVLVSYFALTQTSDIFLVYGLVFRCSLISKAAEILPEMNETLETVTFLGSSLNITRRVIAGTVYSLILASQLSRFVSVLDLNDAAIFFFLHPGNDEHVLFSKTPNRHPRLCRTFTSCGNNHRFVAKLPTRLSVNSGPSLLSRVSSLHSRFEVAGNR